MDMSGNTMGSVSLSPGVPIFHMAWNCERFNMEEQTTEEDNGEHSKGLSLSYVYLIILFSKFMFVQQIR